MALALRTVMNSMNFVDWAQLNDWRDVREPGDPELVAEVIATFVEDSELGLACLVKAVTAGDAVVVKREARMLQAAAALFGAGHLRATAAYVEAEAALSLANLRPLIAELQAALREVQTALKRGVPRC